MALQFSYWSLGHYWVFLGRALEWITCLQSTEENLLHSMMSSERHSQFYSDVQTSACCLSQRLNAVDSIHCSSWGSFVTPRSSLFEECLPQ